MIEIGSWAFLILSLAVLAIAIWGIICNERTHRQRLGLIAWVYDTSVPGDRWIERANWFRRVSYDRHMFWLFLMRDPRDLYGEPPE